ncbi:MAG: efflux RND transporter permease subunit [Verrucomicrobia bacterium]|nr:efflux RND transporter permease subunit [Verrucomicrobiota bacterium]MBV9657368.1 efflux RND transporter permease subunit [Verrucomicrobiota bacterium]
MKFTDLFIRRPVLAIVVNLVILLAGYQAWRVINVRQYPRSDLAVISVTTAYVGANADLVRGFVTTPLERVIASAEGIDFIESSSAQSVSTILVHLKLNYDTNAALTQIQAKVAQVRNDLPPEAEAPVINVQTADDRIASMYLSFYSDVLEPNQITDYLTRVVQPKITAIDGVQRADILGARTFAMRIWLKPDRMAALSVSPTDVRNALSRNNYLSALGATKGEMVSVNLIANTNLVNADEFKKLVVRQQGDTIIRLEEIADVELGAESYDADVRFDGQKATFMGIWVLPTSNSLDVIREVRKTVPDIERSLPIGMKVGIPYDSTKYIDNAISEVVHTLMETLAIVVIVIFLFLGTVRSVLIPVVAIPISLIGALFLMLIFGFTLNLLTLLAIVLSVGLVVDDAIVVVENVERHMHEGERPFDAAIHAARELVGPIIAMTITLAAVYAPIGIQGGLTGALFREFAFTLAGAVVVSGIVALTLSPMMSSRLLRAGDSNRGYAGWVNRRFESVRRTYARLLTGTLLYRPVTLTLAAIVIVFFLPIFYIMSAKELAPKEDQGVIFGIIQAAPNSTLDQTTRYTEKMLDVFRAIPEAEHFFQLTFPSGDNAGFSGAVFKPFTERKRTTIELERPTGAEAAKIPGISAIVTTPAPLPGGSNFPVEFVIASTGDPRELLEFAKQIQKKAVESGTFVFSLLDLKYDQPQAEVVFDRDKVAALGLNLSQVGADLSTMLGGNYVNRFSIEGRSYKVIPQVQRVERLNADQLKDFYVTGPDKKLVPLSTFATIRTTTQPRSLNRFQQLNAVKFQGVFMARPGVTLDTALKVLEDEAARILPKGFVVDYSGEARQLRREGSKFLPLLGLSVVLIFLVLAAQFESFTDPLIILLGSAPLAVAGALMFGFLGATTLNVYSNVGLVTLIGLVAKNGILIVEFANKLQENGLAKLQAVIEAATTRLRPILMTSIATVAGHFPLVIAHGPGAAARNSIGIVLVSGMLIGTLFTLFVVPSIYMVLARNRSLMQPVPLPRHEPNIARELESVGA